MFEVFSNAKNRRKIIVELYNNVNIILHDKAHVNVFCYFNVKCFSYLCTLILLRVEAVARTTYTYAIEKLFKLLVKLSLPQCEMRDLSLFSVKRRQGMHLLKSHNGPPYPDSHLQTSGAMQVP